ncbi:MAG: protein kinase [Candidatus Krumholzibacteria bacterium]|nr:protein kinase [Candidatus Krumholzibacteria bacterium]
MQPKTIAGYEITGTLGEGGMGIVYLARDPTLDRSVALKILRGSIVGPEGRERFLREARACSRINHPNIVTVYAAGEADGNLYMAMELLEGRTLREVIDEGPVEWRQASSWAADILSALERLHEEGIVHRDLKPENMMIGPRGGITLMDFGIAHVSSEARITIDVSGLGTAHYMSPEQATGAATGPRSDIFSMGTILYEMLTGELPFRGEHPMAVMYCIANERHRPMADHPVDVPGKIAAAVETALEKDPGRRHPDAGSFRAELLDSLGPAAGRGLSRRLLVPLAAGLVIVSAGIGLMLRGGGERGDRAAAESHNRLGQERQDAGDMPGAQVEYRNAIIADRRWEIPWNNLAVVAIEARSLDEADSLLRIAIDINPRHAPSLYNMGSVRWDLGDPGSGERFYRRAIESDPSWAQPCNNLGALLLEQGRFAEAKQILEVGIARDAASPSRPEITAFLLKNRGLAAAGLGEPDAPRYWERSPEILPANEEVRRLLADWRRDR